jgi:hypothetical protein
MPHKFWGVEFPLYQEPKAKEKSRKEAAPRKAKTEGALYWPEEALPFARGMALVQIVLQHSWEARAAYHEAINALELPGFASCISFATVLLWRETKDL